MDSDDNDIFLTPTSRLCELAEILAAGILRLHVREALVADSDVDPPAENLPDPGPARLDAGANPVVGSCVAMV